MKTDTILHNLKRKDAFTLAEMLIVVAIIGVLVAVSIPILQNGLERARERTDIANLRAAKACGVGAYYNEQYSTGEYWFIYDLDEARIKEYTDSTSLSEVLASTQGPSGKGTRKVGDPANSLNASLIYNPENDTRNQYIQVHITKPREDYYGVEVYTKFVTADEAATVFILEP